ncbi:MAG: imidazolonepropionase [Flavobacteriaceae bacterium]|nr:imidazolonepropionase [Flavobacteriaceae bacterium]|tara:strand:+ start:80343 stop:81575 length:1233 start_codon:yes stop_codon:yes gene_type:complete
MGQLFINIKELLQVRNASEQLVSGQDMKDLPLLTNAYLWIENGHIKDFGPMNQLPEIAIPTIDCKGKIILPPWCDSHTHLVYTNTREQEFVDRINGLTYEEIAQRGGGILNSAKQIASISEDELYAISLERLEKTIQLGTGAIEIKSGYGLSMEGELKMLRVIKRLQESTTIPIKATFLAAHAIPIAYQNNPDAYIDLIINDMLPVIAKENLADFIDVFCEKGYFSPEQMDRILKAGKKYGLQSKVHVNQFHSIGGIEVAVANESLSVDHLEVLSEQEIDIIKNSSTIPVALPLCSLFLSIPYTPGRKIIDAGLPLAIASDYNPGSAPSSNLNLALSLACIKMKLTPEEAINALTINGAFAMDLATTVGSITKGKKANFMITEPLDSYHQLAYYFGETLIESVYINGKKQ